MKQENVTVWFSALSLIISLLVLSIVLDIRGKKNRVEPDITSLVAEYYWNNLIVNTVLYDNALINSSPIIVPNAEKPCLVIRYSGLGCKLCVDFIAREVSLFFPNFRENESVIFVASDIPYECKEYGKTVILMESESLGLSFEETLVPFVFIVDSGRIQHFFIPDKERPEVFESYLQSIKERYDI